MVKTLKITRIGNSAGAIFPREMMERHNIAVGDQLSMIDTPDGVLLTPYDPDLEKIKASYDKISGKYRNTLRKLA